MRPRRRPTPRRPSTGTRSRLVGAAVLAVALLAVLVAIVTGGDDDDVALDVRDDAATSSTEDVTTSSDESTTTAVPETASTDVEPTASTTTTSGAPSTTTSVFVAEERCASNTTSSPDGLSVEACVVDRARVGETVRVRIRASDGNARVRDDCGSPWVDWGESEQATCSIG